MVEGLRHEVVEHEVRHRQDVVVVERGGGLELFEGAQREIGLLLRGGVERVEVIAGEVGEAADHRAACDVTEELIIRVLGDT